MNNLAQAIWVEMLKARRSKMPVLTALGFLVFPLALGFFMLVLKDPELARRYWLISAKAQITIGRVADWPTYLRLLALSSAMGGFLLFGLIASWVFGREYSDRTVKDLLALPTSRSAIVLAKFVVVASWSAALAVMNCLVGLGVGAAVGLPQASMQVILQGGVSAAIAACLTIVLVTPIAFFASAGRGYLPPMGVALLILFLVQVIAQAGWGEYFPWAIPGLYVQGETLGTVSYVIVVLTGIAGLAGTLLWWEMADQTH
jgi:ABC-2 type transport system permease protein